MLTATFVQNIHNNFTTKHQPRERYSVERGCSPLEMSPFERIFDEVIPKRKCPVLTLACSSYTIWEGATSAHIVLRVLQQMCERCKKRIKRQSRGVPSIEQWRDGNDPRKSDVQKALLRASSNESRWDRHRRGGPAMPGTCLPASGPSSGHPTYFSSCLGACIPTVVSTRTTYQHGPLLS